MKTISEVNDYYRSKIPFSLPGKFTLVCTQSVSFLDDEKKLELFRLVRNFKDFNFKNDPHKEHDFGKVDFEGVSYYFKMDYYDKNLEFGEDPMSENCHRVLTIMETGEY